MNITKRATLGTSYNPFNPAFYREAGNFVQETTKSLVSNIIMDPLRAIGHVTAEITRGTGTIVKDTVHSAVNESGHVIQEVTSKGAGDPLVLKDDPNAKDKTILYAAGGVGTLALLAVGAYLLISKKGSSKRKRK